MTTAPRLDQPLAMPRKLKLARQRPRLWWRWAGVVAASCLLLNAKAQAQTGRLNDTGQTTCYNASNAAVACDAATTGNTGTRPHQDGRYGRDAAASVGALQKTGGGAAGFDFSCVLWNGTVINGPNCTAGLVANITGIASSTPATDWACTKDNVTGLVWSLQTQGPVNWNTATGATYANAGHNTASRCGFSTGWRLPTTRELLSIVHNGLSTGPMVDATYLPSTQNNQYGYWTSETAAFNPAYAWFVYFINALSSAYFKTDFHFVRLVRSGQ
ncbi:MAG: hypothetical protein RIS44_2136 [Pseudomonadota bacterium]|jgi:hypothetical protein